MFPVSTIDKGIEILTGVPAGERVAEGSFPPGSVNGRVEARLIGFSERLRALRRQEERLNQEHEERP